jgi:hypothetical protein
MDRTTLEAFTLALMQEEDQRAVQTALAVLSETKREQGETAFPDLGTILAVVRKAEEGYWNFRSDPPADREPVWLLEDGAAKPFLTGARLKIGVQAEIEEIRKRVRGDDEWPEALRLRYERLLEIDADYRGYVAKLPQPKLLTGGSK